MSNEPDLFLDTTIVISSLIGAPTTRKRISERLSSAKPCLGLIVFQEFKRRHLKELAYLHRVSCDVQSIQEVNRRIEKLPPQQQRKARICQQVVNTIDEQADDKDRLERLRLYCLEMLRYGWADVLKRWYLVPFSRCACARYPIQERKNGQFQFGSDMCSKTGNECGIVEFLESKRSLIEKIMEYLGSTPSGTNQGEKSAELQRAEEFIREFLVSSSAVRSKNPCSTVGDLLIALESADVPNFYTKNAKESQHLCRVLGQTLVVLKSNDEEVICDKNEPQWPKF